MSRDALAYPGNVAALVGRIGAIGVAIAGVLLLGEPLSALRADGLNRVRWADLREPEGGRRVHVHVRQRGRFNQRYALLFRDYLRASPEARGAYEQLKRRAAQLFPENIEGYLFIKEPVFHLIYDAASRWAAQTGGQPEAITSASARGG